jgi:hypothetical protein
MNKKKFLQWGMLLMLSIFVLGAAIPAMAGTDNTGTAKQAWMQNRGNVTGAKWVMNAKGMGNVSAPQTIVKAVAELTNQDLATVMQARKDGKSLLDIAQEKGVTEAALIEKVVATNQARLQGILDAGTITQAQYDTCVAQMKTKIKENLERTNTDRAKGKGQGVGMGQGKGNGKGQGAGMGQGPRSANCTNVTPVAQ